MFQHFLTTLLKGIQWKGHHGLALLQYCVIQGADLVPDLCQSRVKNVLSLDKSLFKRQGCYSRHWEVPIFSSYHSTPRRFHPISTRLWAFSLRDPSKPPFSNPSHQRGVNPKCLSSSKRDLKKSSMQYRITSGQVCHNRITFTKFTKFNLWKAIGLPNLRYGSHWANHRFPFSPLSKRHGELLMAASNSQSRYLSHSSPGAFGDGFLEPFIEFREELVKSTIGPFLKSSSKLQYFEIIMQIFKYDYVF